MLIQTKTLPSRIVKCADLLDNARSWPLLKNVAARKKISRWIKESNMSYLPLAQMTDKKMYHALKKAIAAFKKGGLQKS